MQGTESRRGRGAGADVSALAVDRTLTTPLHQQLYHAIRDLVLEGHWGEGLRLPSSRTMAAELDISRNTVRSAYDQLSVEGFLVRRVGDGTYVALSRTSADNAPRDTAEASPVVVSRRAAASAPLGRSHEVGESPFAIGVPALDAFPLAEWRRSWRRATRRGSGLLSHGEPGGYAPLRRAIASHLAGSRGVGCDAEQVIVLSSALQAMDLAARILAEPGDPVWLEDPCHLASRGVVLANGLRPVAVPVDAQGLRVDRGVDLAPRAPVAFVTPSHQFPTGCVLSLERRVALLAWASDTGAWILEDDYDSEFRYEGRPLAALQGLGPERVIYVGTFSKTLFPALRLAYVVLPHNLIDPFLHARTLIDAHPGTLQQIALADLMERGVFSTHVRRMRVLYGTRRDDLVRGLSDQLPDEVEVRVGAGGLHIVLLLPAYADEGRLATALRARECSVPVLSKHYHGGTIRKGLVVGFGALSASVHADAVAVLAEEVRSELNRVER